jgi:4-amino-4-deoxy-L-arabinose transferase-like glycosyltransferase
MDHNRTTNLAAIAWGTVAVVTALRLAFSASLPLTGDEAYYWEWSRHLAAGYADHPPAVALAIAAFSWLGRSPFAVRLAFVLCGLGTAIAAAGAANRIAGDRRAGAVAALAVTLAPIANVAFGIATPDGPFALAWALSLYFAVRALQEKTPISFVLLGVALGFALETRFFAWALLFGVAAAAATQVHRDAWRRGLWLSFLVALLLYAPFLAWNASHQWISFTFAFVQRHPGHEVQFARPILLYALCLLAFSPGLWIAAGAAALRKKNDVLFWTAVPLSVLLLAVSLHERVEVYWFIGPYISLCVTLGCARIKHPSWVFAPAAALSALVFIAALAPFGVYSALTRAGLHLSDAGPFEMWTYPLVARDVHALSSSQDAAAMTDGYGFSSLLDFYAGVRPVLIGYSAQGEEAYRWTTDGIDPPRALFVDKVPFATRPDFERQFARACSRTAPGPTLSYRYRRYYTTWCEGMAPDGLTILRWKQ